MDERVPAHRLTPGELAASGPRALAHAAEYRQILDAIFHGAELHYAPGGALEAPASAAAQGRDPDLDLLKGDESYAAGLLQLAELGDLDATGQLADLISLLAQARAEDDELLADCVWVAGAVAVGWGTTPALEAAKQAAREGAPGAAQALLEAADAQRLDEH
jgi:hypothetical protein